MPSKDQRELMFGAVIGAALGYTLYKDSPRAGYDGAIWGGLFGGIAVTAAKHGYEIYSSYVRRTQGPTENRDNQISPTGTPRRVVRDRITIERKLTDYD